MRSFLIIETNRHYNSFLGHAHKVSREWVDEMGVNRVCTTAADTQLLFIGIVSVRNIYYLVIDQEIPCCCIPN